MGTHVDGAFAPRIRMPVRSLHRVPEGLSDRAAAICEPLACVCNSLSDPRPSMQETRCSSSGPGAIGLLAAQVARANGGRVHVRGTARTRPGSSWRAASASRPPPPIEPFAGDAPDVVVECSGAEPAIATALETVTRAGTIVQMGLRGARVTVPYDEICFKELRVRAGFAANPVAWRRAMQLLADGAIELESLISGEVELADFQRAFAQSRAAEGVKFVLVP